MRRRFAPDELRHAHAIEMANEGIPLAMIRRQLGHANLGITSIYLQGIDSSEIIDTVHAGRRRRSARPPGSRDANRSGRRPGPSRTGGHTLGWRIAGTLGSLAERPASPRLR